MDRPDELTCHRCHKPLGYLVNDVFAMRCPSCQVFSQPGKGSRGVPADPEILRLQSNLERIDADFHSAKRPYMVRIGGSKASPGKDFDPTEPAADIQSWFAAAVIGVIALVAAFYGAFLIAAVLAALAVWLIRASASELARKRSAFERLTRRRDEARRETLAEIRRRLG
ncbi:MAG: hypothetical protein SF051_08195 [Elusimicrobiota bacterium]|nr:hypothetical protein [Elusimicrobiota bacterium]